MTDSSTGGYLLPASSPLVGDPLTDFFSALVVGITNLPANMVRPRWQPEAPDIPAFGIDWCGIGITDQDPDTYAAEIHHPNGDGSTEIRRHEVLTILASFYGPNGNQWATQFSMGLQVAQNREVFSLSNMGLVKSGTVKAIPTLMKERWLYRFDVEFLVKRQLVGTYNVLNLLAAEAEIITDQPVRTTIVTAS